MKDKIETKLLKDIENLIESARVEFSQVVNDKITTLYWNIGKRINSDISKDLTLHMEMVGVHSSFVIAFILRKHLQKKNSTECVEN